jgi:hypothetical protein
MRTTKLTLAIIIIIGFVVFISSQFISAIDAPHNEGNNVYCGSCHGQTVLESSPFWGGTSSYDQLCLKCHTAAFGPYTDISAPLVKTHSSANTDNRYGDWSRQCVDCHDPHYQLQKDFKNTDANNLYLARGTITSFDPYDIDNNSTTLHYSSITYKTGWDSTKLTAKTSSYRSAILFPNVSKLGYNYSLTAIDEVSKTITVKGDATAYLYPPTNFAIIYGQYIKDYIDTSVLWGVVNIDIGDGADGPITINTVKNINTDVIAGGRSYSDGVNWQITNNVAFGQATISSGTSRPNGFAVGDEIMIINLKGTSTNYSNVGLYEFKTITALPNSTSITVDSNLTNSYDGTTQKIMVQRVPNYTDVTINTGGSLTCNAFDGNKGGVVAFKASGTVTVNAADGITATSKGFSGGNGGGGAGSGTAGETYNGVGTIGGGGGGGSGNSTMLCAWASGGGGGNGGYGNAGSGSNHGNSYGITNLTSKLFLGSGGGGGGGAYSMCYQGACTGAWAAGGNGGNAGGIIYISSNTITVNSGNAISSNGSNGTSGTNQINCTRAYGGGGGGGAGGSIAVLAGQINDSGNISASGGSGAGGGRTYAAYSYFSGNNPSPNYSSSTGRVVTSGSTPFQAQVKFFDQTGTDSFADGYTTYTLPDGYTTYNGICELCHRQPIHFRNDGSASDQNHTNLAFLGNSIPGTNCIACHSHDGGFKPTVSCLSCHSFSINNRANIGAQFGGNSHHVQGTTVTGIACYQCHWEANSDGTMNSLYHGGTSGSAVDLVVYGAGTRPTTYTAGTTVIQYTANGSRTEIKKLNTHCLSCHSAQNSATVPFGDGKTPQQYAWDGKSIDERYSQTGTTPWGKYSGGNVTPKNTQTKAYSAHGNAVNNQGGWNLSETWPNTRNGTENVACFDCHNSHGSTVTSTTTSYTSATTNGGILKDTVAGKGGYTMTYKPQAGGSTANHNAYNAGAGICFDCHLNAASGTTPWGYNGTFGDTQAIVGYRDTPYFGPGTGNPQQRFTYKLSNAIKGGHLGASSALSSTPTHMINGLCTPCHDPHGVSPTLGTNMQYGVPLLKGTWLTSPYKEDRTPQNNMIGTIRSDRGREGVHYYIDQNTFGTDINSSVTGITQIDTQFAGLCLNCHPKNTLTNGTNHTWKSKDRIHESVKDWKTANSNVQHNYPCSKCHIPHNSGLPRLMITNCLDSKHKGFKGNNTVPFHAGSGVGYNVSAIAGEAYLADCGNQTCGDLPGYGNVNCSLKLGFCPPIQNGCRDSGGGHGSGSWPGNWYGGCYNWFYGWGNFVTAHTVTCHEKHDTDQHWNVKTPWASTNSFTPSLIDEPNLVSAAPISVTLEWNSVTSPCYDPVQYNVQLDDDRNFGSPVTSGWISGNNWTVSIPAEGTWYWRVQARDATNTVIVSDWSISDSFVVSQTPLAPVLSPVPDTPPPPMPYTFGWDDVTGPGGDPVQYYVCVSSSSSFTICNYNSGWISGNNWTVSLSTAYTWYWRVKARNANHTTLESPWSAVDSFVDDFQGNHV